MGHAKTDYEGLRNRYLDRKRQKGEGDGWWKPTDGKNKIRILPPPSPVAGEKIVQKAMYVEYGVHYGLGTEDNPEVYTCPRLTLAGKPCPICEFVRSLWKSKTDQDIALARKIGTRPRAASNIVLLTEPSKVYIWGYPKTTRDQIDDLVFASDPPTAIDDPDMGFNLTLSKQDRVTPEGIFPVYNLTPELKPCPIPDKKVLDKLTNLSALLQSRVKSYDELRSILHANPEAPTASEQDPAATVDPAAAASPVVSEEASDEVIEVDTPAPVKTPVAAAPASDVIAQAKAALARRQQAGK